jgi:hypothetical protein
MGIEVASMFEARTVNFANLLILSIYREVPAMAKIVSVPDSTHVVS